ncbi:crossover junction endodeoxyribonuclease RuvC [Candidatus Gracilibacteria bacterium]|nr:crossover junction endodeoxyribonuclease RuvC [Candidatus Gracilibacteria bacterium]
MKILGIDPGFGLCGFAVLDEKNKQLDLETFGVIRTTPKKNFADRLLEIAQDFEKLLQKYQPDIVSIEDLFFTKNVTTGMQVAQVRGILILLSHKFGCRIVEPKPVEVKNCFTGNGRATKPEMKKMAQLLFKLEKIPHLDDAADAVAIAYFVAQNKNIIL